MLCRRCLRAATQSTTRQRRTISQSTSFRSTPISPNDATAAQPSSTPTTPAAPRSAGKDRATQIPQSSVSAGVVLKGLNLLKGKQDPVAMRDEEYPAWLWTLLVDEKSKSAGAGDGEGDLYAKSAKERKKAAKAQRKREEAMAARGDLMAPPTPIEEQAVDLPRGDSLGTSADAVRLNADAAGPRREITKALRQKRRAKIKESNFLKSMG